MIRDLLVAPVKTVFGAEPLTHDPLALLGTLVVAGIIAAILAGHFMKGDVRGGRR